MWINVPRTIIGITRHRGVALLMLLVCLVVAGCAQHDRAADEENRSGGFYGGVSGGLSR